MYSDEVLSKYRCSTPGCEVGDKLVKLWINIIPRKMKGQKCLLHCNEAEKHWKILTIPGVSFAGWHCAILDPNRLGYFVTTWGDISSEQCEWWGSLPNGHELPESKTTVENQNNILH